MDLILLFSYINFVQEVLSDQDSHLLHFCLQQQHLRSPWEYIHVLINLLNLRSDIRQASLFQATSEYGCSQFRRALALR